MYLHLTPPLPLVSRETEAGIRATQALKALLCYNVMSPSTWTTVSLS